jgi:hypothetical protein
MKNEIKPQSTYASLKNDTNDILKLMIEYKDNEELLSWCRRRLEFNLDRMVRILQNKDE